MGSLITVFTSTQLLAASPVLPPFSGITQSRTHGITIDNNSDSSFQLTLSPGGTYDILANYGYQIPVAPNTQFNLAAVTATATTSNPTPRLDYGESQQSLPYSEAPTSPQASQSYSNPILQWTWLAWNLTTSPGPIGGDLPVGCVIVGYQINLIVRQTSLGTEQGRFIIGIVDNNTPSSNEWILWAGHVTGQMDVTTVFPTAIPLRGLSTSTANWGVNMAYSSEIGAPTFDYAITLFYQATL